MYGNVDAEIKVFILLASHVTNKKGMNMFQSEADPYCVFYKLNKEGNLILIVSVTVNECSVTGMES